MLGRIRLKEGSEARRIRRLRRSKVAVEAKDLYADFVGDPEGEAAELCKV